MKNHIVFTNSQKDTAEKYLLLWRNEETELEKRIFERVMAHLRMTATGHEAIKEIEKLQRELDKLEKRFQ